MEFNNYKNPILIFNNGIGDHIINLPTIRALSEIFKNQLTFVCHHNYFELLYSDITFKRVVNIEFYVHNNNRTFSIHELLNKVNESDLIINLNPWQSPEIDKIIDFFSAKSIGFFENYDFQIIPDNKIHSANQTFEFAKLFDSHLNISKYSQVPFLPITSQQKADKILAVIPKKYKVLVIHADTSDIKMWSIEEFKKFINLFLQNFKNFVIVIVGTKEIGMSESSFFNDRLISMIGLPLAISISLVSKSDFFIGVDSCMLHIADIFKIPSIAIFMLPNFKEFGFRVNKSSIILFRPKNHEVLFNEIQFLIKEAKE